MVLESVYGTTYGTVSIMVLPRIANPFIGGSWCVSSSLACSANTKARRGGEHGC